MPRSRELNTAAILLAGSAALLAFGDSLSSKLAGIARDAFQIERSAIFDPHAMGALLDAAVDIPYILLARWGSFFVRSIACSTGAKNA